MPTMKILFAQANLSRKKPFQIQIIIFKDNKKIFVRKIALTDDAFKHLNGLKNNYLVIKKNKISTPKIIVKKFNYIDFEFLTFPSLEYFIEEKIYEQDFENLNDLIKIGFDFINSLKTTKINPYQNKEFTEIFDPKNLIKKELEECLNLGVLDINFDNLLFDSKKNKIYLIDFEWFFNFPIPKKLILFRSIFYLSLHLQSLIKNRCSPKFPCLEIFKNFYIPKIFWQNLGFNPEEIKKYYYWEINFQNYLNQMQIKYYENIFLKQFNEKKEKLDNSLYKFSFSQINQLTQLQSQLQHQSSQIQNLETQIKQLQDHAKNLETQLNTIKSAKFFRLRQSYCKIRDKILRRKY
jgi:DNA-binding transcriptional MerR regulator